MTLDLDELERLQLARRGPFSKPTCKGSFTLGTACRHCERCEAEMRYQAAVSVALPALIAAAREAARLRTELYLLRVEFDPPICRLQFPDGSVPGNAREGAEGWHRWHSDEQCKRRAAEADNQRLREVLKLVLEVGLADEYGAATVESAIHAALSPTQDKPAETVCPQCGRGREQHTAPLGIYGSTVCCSPFHNGPGKEDAR